MSRLFLGAFGDPGHAFPMIALGAELARRGNEVTLQTWTRWREHVEAEGMAFAPAMEYQVFPTRDRPMKPYQAVARAARDTVPQLWESGADCVIADVITLAPAIAGEMAGLPVGTLVPHVDPRPGPGFPPYSIGARLPRTRAGRALWRQTDRVVRGGLERGRADLNETRRRVGLPPRPYVHNGISRELCLVATLPQLEYPRAEPYPGTHVVGPLLWEIGGEPAVAPPPGDPAHPVVLVAPSTSQDPGHRMLRAALEGLADEPVRVIATWNRREPNPPLEVPANAVAVDWLSYARTMPACDAVVCHAGHGTVVRALASGCAVVCCPAAGDMGENAARIDWAGLGTRLPRRLVTPLGVRLAVRRALASERVRRNVAAAAAWCAGHDGAARAAELVERLAASRGAARRAGAAPR
ncbi:MAG TPA: nucleotide disphospho-sugar-binding domain-containing protein [Solirubrobacteraceae bacterium]|nr:nucleotide disphospho-sugar-binding domain-containing protein [Solirubrobacteraceae bacterium]